MIFTIEEMFKTIIAVQWNYSCPYRAIEDEGMYKLDINDHCCTFGSKYT